MITHKQKSNKTNKIFIDINIIESEGNINVEAGEIYIFGKIYVLGNLMENFPLGSRLFIEDSLDEGIRFLLDLTGFAIPNKIRNHPAILIAWHDDEGIHSLRSIDEKSI